MQLTSPDFKNGQRLNESEYNAIFKSAIPRLSWSKIPHDVKSLAIIIAEHGPFEQECFWYWQIIDMLPVPGSISPDMLDLPSGRVLANDINQNARGVPLQLENRQYRMYTIYLLGLRCASLTEAFAARGYPVPDPLNHTIVSAMLHTKKIAEVKLQLYLKKNSLNRFKLNVKVIAHALTRTAV